MGTYAWLFMAHQVVLEFFRKAVLPHSVLEKVSEAVDGMVISLQELVRPQMLHDHSRESIRTIRPAIGGKAGRVLLEGSQ